jgi:cyclopropane fatty-acyl-phospholipid synthase-like methyltransferase
MKENKYDNISFFDKYKQMPRSVEGLKAAGEWHVFQKMLPNLENKRVLDLGCGFGWHCRYAIEQGAKSVVGIDISERMLNEAEKNTLCKSIEYIKMPIEDVNYSGGTFDIVISSLAFHYLKSCEEIFDKVNTCLTSGGNFIFSVEHPVFTSNEKQDWYYDEQGDILHWPVDNYSDEGIRKTIFLGEQVIKYHRTISSYINNLLKSGFEIVEISEPEPDPKLLNRAPEMKHELRRPMFLIISTRKNS